MPDYTKKSGIEMTDMVITPNGGYFHCEFSKFLYEKTVLHYQAKQNSVTFVISNTDYNSRSRECLLLEME